MITTVMSLFRVAYLIVVHQSHGRFLRDIGDRKVIVMIGIIGRHKGGEMVNF